MLNQLYRRVTGCLWGVAGMSVLAANGVWADNMTIEQAVANPLRTEANVSRDSYRHPAETLTFFEVTGDSTVVEIWPGRGWYTEILAPLLAENGTFYAAHFAKETPVAYFQKSRQAFEEMVKDKPELYKGVVVTEFEPAQDVLPGPVAKVDHVLTFRNVHNWLKADTAEKAFAEFYQVLKPGGILGVVEHRAKPGTSLNDMVRSGYVTEEKVIELAEQAGFVFAGRSEVNANEKDSADHPKGVWTLPPTLRLGDQDRDKYTAIGESDRMTLKFRKPE
ncbi:methyltransferase domain-containing protein [Aestuariicella sp. G3-2]|uniref:class I SAM-dependent methyltransferase n=1 Tax=Pseudomaricurvus albidus TaxID=2842452 RepID=UPI001C0D5CB0|nr:methyltransferase domain-containing protein [Aestuariicella albida]MBU3070799.1 methyltransferase domain-containing protein [Aestuariicella albida]